MCRSAPRPALPHLLRRAPAASFRSAQRRRSHATGRSAEFGAAAGGMSGRFLRDVGRRRTRAARRCDRGSGRVRAPTGADWRRSPRHRSGWRRTADRRARCEFSLTIIIGRRADAERREIEAADVAEMAIEFAIGPGWRRHRSTRPDQAFVRRCIDDLDAGARRRCGRSSCRSVDGRLQLVTSLAMGDALVIAKRSGHRS